MFTERKTQIMKAINLFVAVLLIAVNAGAADALTEKLQRGLFEEEANRNLDAAIKEYQAVVTQSDEQRKVTATALFRLGECYRKLGKTNEAAAFYQRITRDFSEQEQLAKLANDLLRPAASAASSQSPVVQELERRLAHLGGCLGRLPGNYRKLVEGYYFRREGVEALAVESTRSVEATYKLLQRVRHALQQCIESAEGQEEAAT